MPDDVVTVVLEGAPTLDDLAQALTGLRDVLRAATAEVAEGARIDWTIVSLDIGSASIGLRGVPIDDQTDDVVERVVTRTETVAAALAAARPVEGSPQLQSGAHRFQQVVNARVTSLRVETVRDDFTIAAETDAVVIPLPKARSAFGAVTGRVQTLTNRGSLRFTLYDLANDKPVSCYLAEGYTEIVRGVWGKLAQVEGIVRRNRDGRPTTVRDVRAVRVVEDSDPRSWRDALGAVPRQPDQPRAEAAIRKMRDAQ